jgi:hypothetical protein
MLREYYAGCPFVRVLDNAPRVKDIVASNYAHVSAAANGRTGRRDERGRQPQQGRRRWRRAVDEPPVRLAETAGLTAPAAGWT